MMKLRRKRLQQLQRRKKTRKRRSLAALPAMQRRRKASASEHFAALRSRGKVLECWREKCNVFMLYFPCQTTPSIKRQFTQTGPLLVRLLDSLRHRHAPPSRGSFVWGPGGLGRAAESAEAGRTEGGVRLDSTASTAMAQAQPQLSFLLAEFQTKLEPYRLAFCLRCCGGCRAEAQVFQLTAAFLMESEKTCQECWMEFQHRCAIMMKEHIGTVCQDVVRRGTICDLEGYEPGRVFGMLWECLNQRQSDRCQKLLCLLRQHGLEKAVADLGDFVSKELRNTRTHANKWIVRVLDNLDKEGRGGSSRSRRLRV
ncbi:unnamed protein product [Symbiodinium sp. CCMP2592]|nr:unnamed protein product [Symbiodinium sp. CCMP2592]